MVVEVLRAKGRAYDELDAKAERLVRSLWQTFAALACGVGWGGGGGLLFGTGNLTGG